jgi:hypothetical protein
MALTVWTVAIACGGCGKGTVCEEAASKMAGECKVGGGYSLGGNGECVDDVECRAECVVDASCKEITDVDQNPQTNDYAQCLADCAAQPIP